jgi:hypothetical protein
VAAQIRVQPIERSEHEESKKFTLPNNWTEHTVNIDFYDPHQPATYKKLTKHTI